jgi:oxidoreductase
VKVDKTYPLLAADIAVNNSNFSINIEIPHYSLVSSMGSNPNSWFLYMKTKGEVERDLKLKKINLLSIYRPGLLLNRINERIG